MKDIVIVGFGGFGREVAWLAEDCGRKVVGFLDDGLEPGEVQGHIILGNVESWTDYGNAEFLVAVGSPRTRRLIVNRMRELGNPSFATLVHPSVVMSSSVTIGEGTVVCAGSIATVNIDIAEHVIVNLNVTIGHDCKVGAYCTFAPMVAISGCVNFGEGAEVGTGSSIRQGVTVGAGAMLGMGGCLVQDAEDNGLYVGTPAKFLKQLPEFA